MTIFTWNTSIGVWGIAANWLDVTNGDMVAASPPGAADSVSISEVGGSAGDTITGPGASSDLNIETSVTLNGTFATGSLNVAPVGGSFAALDLSAGTMLSASSVAVAGGVLNVSGDGAALTDAGMLTVGSTPEPGQAYLSPDVEIDNHARVQATGLTLLGGYPDVYVDGTSTLEVGTAGTAVAGALTVDAGAIVAGSGSLTDATVIDNGTVIASGGTLSVDKVSGSGTLEVGADATLILTNYDTAVSNALAFTGSDGSLELATSNVDGATTGSFHGVISGFAAGDSIFAGIQADLAIWTPAEGGLGTLTILNEPEGSFSDGTPPPPRVDLTLAGDYTGQTFYVIPAASQSALGFSASPGQAIVLGATEGSGPAPSGTAGDDSFQWVGTSGKWSDVANWQDVTANADPAIVAPGSLDAVTIVGATGTNLDLITGPGDAAELTITNAVALAGTFATGTLEIGIASGSDGTLDLLADTTVSADSVAIDDGSLVVTGIGANLIDSGAMTLGTAVAPDEPGADFDNGFLTVSNHASAEVASLTLSLASRTVGGHLAYGVASASVDDTSILQVGSGGSPTLDGIYVAADGSIAGAGSISGPDALSIIDDGTITASGGTLSLGSFYAPISMTGNGELQIEANATLAITASEVSPDIEFAGPGADLSIGDYQFGGIVIDGPETFQSYVKGTISGFAVGDSISLGFAASDPVWTPTGNGTGDLLINGDFELTLAGDYSHHLFVAAPQGSSASTITLACFCAGSRILMERGSIAVEDLCIGERVITRDGAMPIRWIGHREIDLARHPHPDRARPVRIRRGAFADDVPQRDLLISPDHSAFVDGVLIPVKYLVNGTSIVLDRTIKRPRYYHLDLAEHAVLFAEGLTVESLLPGSDRSVFDNGDGHIQLHPDLRSLAWEANGYAPLVVFGTPLDEVRKKLATREPRTLNRHPENAWYGLDLCERPQPGYNAAVPGAGGRRWTS